MFNFSYLDLYFIIGGLFWPITVPIGAVFVFAVYKAANPLIKLVSVIAAIIFLIPPGWYASWEIPQMWHAHERQRIYEAHSWTLEHTRRVSGFEIPAGSTLHINTDFDMSNRHGVSLDDIDRIELAAPTTLFGARVQGTFTHDSDYWQGQLAADQAISAVPCKQGPVKIAADGKALACTLRQPKAFLGYRFPAGTQYDLSKKYEWTFDLPSGARLIFDPETQKLTGGWTGGDHNLLFDTRVPPEINALGVDYKQHVRTLTHAHTISGDDIPAGSTITALTGFDMAQWQSITLDDVVSIQLSQPARLFGIQLAGTLTYLGDHWQARMAKAQKVGDWYCEGAIMLTAKGKAMSCRLARPQLVFGYTLPRGTVAYFRDYGAWRFNLPDGGLLYFDPKEQALVSGHTNDQIYFTAPKIPESIEQMREQRASSP